jgi:PIN domain nuclease of toxin-antitoxin system
MDFVLDACALIAFLRDEEGADVVESTLIDEECIAHVVNLCEVYYDCLRRDDKSMADELLEDLWETGLVRREDIDVKFWKSVGHIKADIGKVSLADSFAIALAQRTDATVLTSDHHEFDRIAEENVCHVKFIR